MTDPKKKKKSLDWLAEHRAPADATRVDTRPRGAPLLGMPALGYGTAPTSGSVGVATRGNLPLPEAEPSPTREASAMGWLADFMPVEGEARGLKAGHELARQGHPFMGAAMAAASVLPLGGPLAKKLGQKLPRLARAAIQLPDGSIHWAANHAAAIEAARRAGKLPDWRSPKFASTLEKSVDGFVDESGAFLTRDETTQRLQALGMKSGGPGMSSEELRYLSPKKRDKYLAPDNALPHRGERAYGETFSSGRDSVLDAGFASAVHQYLRDHPRKQHPIAQAHYDEVESVYRDEHYADRVLGKGFRADSVVMRGITAGKNLRGGPLEFTLYRGAPKGKPFSDNPSTGGATFMTPDATGAAAYVAEHGARGTLHEISGTFERPLRGSMDEVHDILGLKRSATSQEQMIQAAREQGYDAILTGKNDNTVIALDNSRLSAKELASDGEHPAGTVRALVGTDDAKRILAQMQKTSGGKNLPRVKVVDAEKAKKMAQIYESLPKHDPEAASAYDALNTEVDKQYRAIIDAGHKIEFVDADPYKSSKEMIADVRDNKRLKVFKTQGDQQHPYMTPEQNDRFRAVHDWLAHAGEGHSFGPIGEENAYRVHSSTLSPLAQRALATETRGQNSWVNFGPFADLPVAKRPYAEQKAALWPEKYLGDYKDMAALLAGFGLMGGAGAAVAARPTGLFGPQSQ